MVKLFLSLIATLTVAAVKADDGFTIKGHIPGLKKGTKIEIVNKDVREDNDAWLVLDTVAYDDGFVIEGSVKMPTYCEFRIYTNEEDNKVSACYMMVENVPMEISVASIDSIPPIFSAGPWELYRAKNVKIKGGEAQREFEEFRAYLLPYEAEMKMDNYNLYWTGEKGRTKEETNKLSEKYDKSREAYKNAISDFIEQHPQYHISAMYWIDEINRPFVYTSAQLDEIWDKVKGNNSPARLAMLKRNVDKTRHFLKDTKYTDFEAFDPDNASHKFSDVTDQGKYTIVDFWASWCGPCRAAIPNVRKIYKKYGDKINVLAVSVDKDDSAWRMAMDKEKMEWAQWRVTPENAKLLGDTYNFSSIPFMLLIDPNGHIAFAGHNLDAIDKILMTNVGAGS